MKTKKVDYKAAVSELASIAGITLPEIKPSSNNLMRDAAIFYHSQLKTNSKAKSAIDQLHAWGIKGKTIVQLGIGFHDNSFNCFIEYMTKQKSYTIAQLEEANLIAKSSKGNYCDKMRNSIIIPTIDEDGNIVYDEIPVGIIPESCNAQLVYDEEKGKTYEEILENMGMVVEGVATTKAAYELAQEKGIDMPITAAIYRVLFENARVDEVVEELMLRDRKAEHSTSKMTAEEE